jgi:hypothetical protein
MMEYSWRVCLILAGLVFLGCPSGTFGQDRMRTVQQSKEFGIAARLGIAESPEPRVVVGAQLSHPILGPVTGFLDYPFYTPAFVSGDHSWPESYRCSLKGQSVLVGGEMRLLWTAWTELSADSGLGCFFRRGGPPRNRASFTRSAGFGIRFSPRGTVSWKAHVRKSWMLDDGYKDLFQEDFKMGYMAIVMEIHTRN